MQELASQPLRISDFECNGPLGYVWKTRDPSRATWPPEKSRAVSLVARPSSSHVTNVAPDGSSAAFAAWNDEGTWLWRSAACGSDASVASEEADETANATAVAATDGWMCGKIRALIRPHSSIPEAVYRIRHETEHQDLITKKRALIGTPLLVLAGALLYSGSLVLVP